MSDCFDHYTDAMSSYEDYHMHGREDDSYNRQSNVDIYFDEILAETEKAFLIKRSSETCWIPKSQVVDFSDSRLAVRGWVYDKLVWS